jgi:hypothetical protein
MGDVVIATVTTQSGIKESGLKGDDVCTDNGCKTQAAISNGNTTEKSEHFWYTGN